MRWKIPLMITLMLVLIVPSADAIQTLRIKDSNMTTQLTVSSDTSGNITFAATATGPTLNLDDMNITTTGTISYSGSPTWSLTSNQTLDDGAGESPKWIVRDGSDQEGQFYKIDTGHMVLYNDTAGDGLALYTSNDTNDYLVFTTASDVPTTTVTGSADWSIQTDGAGNGILFQLGTDTDDYIAWTTASNVPTTTLTGACDWNIVTESGGEVNLMTSGDSDDYISFLTTTNVPQIKLNGCTQLDIISDTDDYIYFNSASNVPSINTSGSCDLDILTASAEINLMGPDADDYLSIGAATNVPQIKANGCTQFDLLAGDSDDYLSISSSGNEMLISTTGSCDMHLVTASAEINLIGADTDDYISIGASANVPQIKANGSCNIELVTGATEYFDITTGLLMLANGEVVDNVATDALVSIRYDDDAAELGELRLVSDNAHGSLADNDYVTLTGVFDDDAGNVTEYGAVQIKALDVSSGSEDGAIEFNVTVNGTPTEQVQIDNTGIMLENGEYLVNSTDGTVQIYSDTDESLIYSLKSMNATNGTVSLDLVADAAGDAGDGFRIQASASETLIISNDTAVSGTYVTKLTLDGSTGNITLTGDIVNENADTIMMDTDDSWVFASNDEAATIVAYGFDDKSASLVLDADTGDDNADTWTITSEQSDNDLNIYNHTTELINITTAGNMQIDGTFTPSSGINLPVVVVTDAAEYDVLAANTGKVHIIGNLAQNTSIDLPVEAAGLYYKFIFCAAADEAHDHTIDSENDTNYFIGGVAFADTDAGAGADEINAGIYADGNSNSKLTINNSSAGTTVDVYCDGTNWYVTGIIVSDTAPAFADQ